MLDTSAVVALTALLGLLVGSFLNVVIYRLPKMLEQRWAAECAHLEGQSPKPSEPFNLIVPRSRCRRCGHVLRWYENIPVLSFIWLRAKCSSCGTGISLRYPLVELAAAALFGFCGWRWGLSATALAWAGMTAALLTLGLIDWDTTLLPDDINLPLLWSGLVAAALHWIETSLAQAFWGAVAGYLSLWLVYWSFRLLTGKEGMGYGDFKLFAALGAWFGWQALVPIILLASVTGAVVGLAMKLGGKLREGGYLPFGPFLAASGLSALIFGPQAILRLIGLPIA